MMTVKLERLHNSLVVLEALLVEADKAIPMPGSTAEDFEFSSYEIHDKLTEALRELRRILS